MPGPSATFAPISLDVAFLPTAFVVLASYYVAENVCKVKFFSSTAMNLLMWGLINFSICYGNTLSTRVIGDATYATIDKLALGALGPAAGGQLYALLNVAYHGALSVLALSILLAGGAGKMNWFNVMFFTTLWTIGVYVPLTHWQSAVQAAARTLPETSGVTNLFIGWMSAGGSGGYGVLDHAGAQHVNMAAGASAMVLCFFLGTYNTAVKASTDWNATLFGTLGMIAYLTMGDPNSMSGGAGPALICTLMSVAGAVLTACVLEVIVNDGVNFFGGKPKTETITASLHYGLVAVTAGASLISPMWAVFFGFFTYLTCYILNAIFARLQLSGLGANSVFSIHFLGAATSSALTGLFANPTYGLVANNAGSFYGNPIQLGRQCAGISTVLLVASLGTAIIYGFVLLISKAFGNATMTLDEGSTAEKPLTSTEASAV